MIISVNGAPLEVPKETNLSTLLSMLKVDRPAGIAVALNETVVPRNDWEKMHMQPNDQVLIIRATQGG
jgi:sulfur carrier protein